MTEGYFNVKEWGATGDGQTDDTAAIQKTIRIASGGTKKTVGSGTVYFPPGVYRVSSPIVVTDGEFFGCRLEGANAESVKVVPLPAITDTDKLFIFRGGSGAFSNVGAKNMTIGYDPAIYSNPGHGVGIYLEGQCFAIFENVRCKNLKYGVWLHNDRPKSFSELNQFHQMEFSYCQNGVRVEQGGGANSFHGNDFNNCYFNISSGQIGFNHQSGFLYNARFRLFMWAHSTEAVYVNADGNAVNNIGDITYESFEPGQLTGKGRFWFDGFFRGIRGVNDQTKSREPWQQVFACTNYWKPKPYQDTDMKAGPMNAANNSYNGELGFFQALRKDGVESVVLNTYRGSEENGLYLGRSGFQQRTEEATLGLFLSAAGDKIKSYHSQPLVIENPEGIEFRIGETKGLKWLAGQVNIKGGGNTYRWQQILSFKHMIGGRLFLLDQENAPTLITIVDIIRNNTTEEIKFVSEVMHENKNRQEHLKVRFRNNPPALQVGANIKEDTSVHWYFQGLTI